MPKKIQSPGILADSLAAIPKVMLHTRVKAFKIAQHQIQMKQQQNIMSIKE